MPHDPETEDTDMMRIIGRWFGFDWEWMKHFTPYAQVILNFTYLRQESIKKALPFWSKTLYRLQRNTKILIIQLTSFQYLKQNIQLRILGPKSMCLFFSHL